MRTTTSSIMVKPGLVTRLNRTHLKPRGSRSLIMFSPGRKEKQASCPGVLDRGAPLPEKKMRYLGRLAGVTRRSALCHFSSLDSQDGRPRPLNLVEDVAAARGEPGSPRVPPSRMLATSETSSPTGTSHVELGRLTAQRSRAEISAALRPRSSRIPSLKRTRTWQFTESPASPAQRTRQLLAVTWCPDSEVRRQIAERTVPGAGSPGPWLRVAEAGDVDLVALCEPASGLPGSVSRGARPRPRHVVRLRTSDSRHLVLMALREWAEPVLDLAPGLGCGHARRGAMSLGKVLIVDDEAEVRRLLQEFLSLRGYDVVLAGSGMEALEAVEGQKPDLVLLDVAMPEMDGVETLGRIVALEPALPVIMVTANTDISVTSKLLAMGAVDYIPKPFDLEYLDQAVSIQLAAGQDR